MIGNPQRWRERRDSYRPAGEPIDVRRYEVARIPDDVTARAFVERHHYSGSFPAARFRFGLYRGPVLVGVAVFSVPANNLAITNVFRIEATDGAELGRFVLLDDVPANGETWFLARCFRDLRRDVAGVVSFSDPVARTAADGRVVFPGHIGTIYQAKSAVYLGRSKPETLRLLPDGAIMAPRALAKIRKRDRGWRYAAERLERAGAAPLGERDDARAWLALWLPRVTRQFKHTGNHKYAWALDKALARQLPEGLSYPKRDALREAA